MPDTPFSLTAFLFPWLAPYTIQFVVVDGGIGVHLFKNKHMQKDWRSAQLRRLLSEPLIAWIEQQRIPYSPQPYPVVRQLWQRIAPLASKKLIIDATELEALQEIPLPHDFALTWNINMGAQHIEGKYEGADRSLGMGWFQKGRLVWSLQAMLSPDLYAILDRPVLAIQQADTLCAQIIPTLQRHMPVWAEFQIIRDFAPQVQVANLNSWRLQLSIQYTHPQTLTTILQPQQGELLLAQQAVIVFPRYKVTETLLKLLQNSGIVTLQDSEIPLFVTEHLPVMEQYQQISMETAARIKQAYPIVQMATLQAGYIVTHAYNRNGIGAYYANGSYQHGQKILLTDALLRAHQQGQRFVQQEGIWFQWPENGQQLFKTMSTQVQTTRVTPAEVMGFETARMEKATPRPDTRALHGTGRDAAERGKATLDQLRHHGIPGVLMGKTAQVIPLFLHACEKIIRINQQARILWIVTSKHKGLVTRALRASTVSSFVTTASLVTLRDQPELFRYTWALVIFQDVEQLHDGSIQAVQLANIQREWSLASVTSLYELKMFMLPTFHLLERYHLQFCDHYVFDPEKVVAETKTAKTTVSATVQALPKVSQPASTASTLRRTISLDPHKINQAQQQSERIQERLSVKEQEERVTLSTAQSASQPVPHAIRSEFRRETQTAPVSQAHITYAQSDAVATRLAVLKQYWHKFENIHNNQQSSMKPLWGLIEDPLYFDFRDPALHTNTYQMHLYKERFTPALLTQIEQLWGTKMLVRWPERIISEAFPHALMADTFGIALEFWHSCALTVWFCTEGPSSRTPLSEFPEYYQKKVQLLQEIGTPIDERLFKDLKKADEEMPRPRLHSTHGGETHKEGFARLNNIVAHYRKKWAEKYLDTYLQTRYQSEIHALILAWQLQSEQNREAVPTKKTVAEVEKASNHWFGGNIRELYKTIQKPTSLIPQHVRLLPHDSMQFAHAIHKELSRAEQANHHRALSVSKKEGHQDMNYYDVNKLTNLSFWYVQLEEALGRTPTLPEFGTSKFSKWSLILHENIDSAWTIFASIIEATRKRLLPPTTQSTPAQTPVTDNKATVSPIIGKAQPAPERVQERPQVKRAQPEMVLDKERISKLQEESERIQQRLTVEDNELEVEHRVGQDRETVEPVRAIPVQHEEMEDNEGRNDMADIDQDWQPIVQQWRTEHWEVLTLLVQGQKGELAAVARRYKRPLSKIIDEMNTPVDEHLNDLIINSVENTIPEYYQPTADNLVRWYLASKR